MVEMDPEKFVLRTECEAYRSMYAQKITSVNGRVDSVESLLADIKGSIADMRNENKTEYNALNNAFSNFTIEFRRQIIYILFVSCIILISVLVGRSVDFGWIISK